MKHLSLISILILALAVLFMGVEPALAQKVLNPAKVVTYYTFPASTAKSYSHSFIDTTSGANFGGASLLSMTYTYTDTMNATVYLDYKIRGTSSWTLAYTDSVKATAAGKSEIYFRLPGATSRVGGVDRSVRIRTAQMTTSKYDTSATFTNIWNWKP